MGITAKVWQPKLRSRMQKLKNELAAEEKVLTETKRKKKDKDKENKKDN